MAVRHIGMEITPDQAADISWSLDEISGIDLTIDEPQRVVSLTFDMLLAPRDGELQWRRVTFELSPVGRVLASVYRDSLFGRSRNEFGRRVAIRRVGPEELAEVLRAPYMVGNGIMDDEPQMLPKFPRPHSLDLRFEGGGQRHNLFLWQGSGKWYVHLGIWFDDLGIRDEEGHEMSIDDFLVEGPSYLLWAFGVKLEGQESDSHVRTAAPE
jgi:hypothetical protein